MITDSVTLFNVIARSSHMYGERLMIDLTAVHEAYNHYEMDAIGWTAKSNIFSDAFKKIGTNMSFGRVPGFRNI